MKIDKNHKIRVNMEFGILKVIGPAFRLRDSRFKNSWYACVCECECGNKIVVHCQDLKQFHITSCGCEIVKVKQSKQLNQQKSLIHRNLYIVLYNMKQRCLDKNHPDYRNYGSRGITVCDEWRDTPTTFIEWAMNNGYKKGLSIDRINNDGNYEPSNCRFVDRHTQNNNKRTNHIVEYFGKKYNITELSKLDVCKVSYRTLDNRIRNLKWPIEDAVDKPLMR